MRGPLLAAVLLLLAAPAAAAHDVYTLRVTLAGTGSGKVSSPSGINCASSCATPLMSGTKITLMATPDSGSTFAGWSGGLCSGLGDCTVNMFAEEVAVTATFNATGASSGPPPSIRTGVQPLTFTLTVRNVQKSGGSGGVVSAPAGIDCGAACRTDFPAGSVVALRATPTTGGFLGWSGGSSATTDTLSVVMNANTDLTATFGATELEIVTPSALPSGRVGADYSVPIRLAGGTERGGATFRVVSGSLPPGLRLRFGRGADSAVIAGRPTRPGTRTFTLQATRGGETASKRFGITIER